MTTVESAVRTPSVLPPAMPVDLVAAGVVSAAGTGLQPLADALRQGAAAGGRADAEEGEAYPPMPLLAADFSPADLLGRKGLGRLTRTDRLGMAACALALAGADDPDGTGVVLGTSVGSTGGIARFTRETFVQERPYLVNPSDFPGTLMNSAAGRTAIRHGLTDTNATLSGGPLSSLYALRFARNALLHGHARQLLAGGVEELSPHGAWAWHRARVLAPGTALGEGAAVFALRRPAGHGSGQAPLARLAACEAGFADPARGPLAVGLRLARCVRDALARSGIAPADVAVVAPGAAGRRGWAAVEERALRTVLPPAPGRHRLRVQAVTGETHGAGVALQLAAVLARWQDPHTDAGRERAAVVTSLSSDGAVGCAVLLRPDAAC
ncbi:beta-ketoacyl synthase N-terminal-like domain-containing protein [Streptomyces morookaense]|uniref:Beta-ketoacyl synthase-like N-terminal domain-containing protein n=1 Tax=Streptomyces morookaense TaxID=1970 RepID=A0A7Y7B551_STRMO|nr:beta-ketoacyl synthase N-terminal-like domain-containing protein [Streptomyces morookaense]NVK79198.1 hypothetical protein [Streptomyces morookaense]GHF27810.1 hypothetical protein GCM10010359_32730 [Streptomyces morookaense]